MHCCCPCFKLRQGDPGANPTKANSDPIPDLNTVSDANPNANLNTDANANADTDTHTDPFLGPETLHT